MTRPLAILCILALSACASQTDDLSRWQMRQEGQRVSYEVTVPCTVAGALENAGALGPGLREGMQYASASRTPFDSPWVFTTSFRARKGKRHILRFEGLNYYADIDLNGQRIASSDTTFGPFCVREFDVSPLIRHSNRLQVTLRRAVEGDLNHGYVDWNPRPLDESMGIIRPVSLITTPDVEVQDVFVKPLLDPSHPQQATLEVQVTLINRSPETVRGELRGQYEDGVLREDVELEAGEIRVFNLTARVEHPRLWWTREMGSPELYHMDVSFLKDGIPSHGKKVRFGIRDIRSTVDSLGHRLFLLNGRKVLVKAAGWTDDLLMQDTPESVDLQMRRVADMRLNCIRFENVWSKDNTVYDLCDSLGILSLVGWSCQWEWEKYCGRKEIKGYGFINDEASESLAARYFHDQVIRLRNHPSLIGWLGGSDRTPNPRLEERYLALYDRLDYRPYICSASGLSGLRGPSGLKMTGPYEYVGPDYWYFDTRIGGADGFNSETGPGLNIPQEETLRRMLGGDLWPQGPAWAFHCTASDSGMNSPAYLNAAMEGLWGKAEDLQDYLRKAHAMDYDSVRSMYEAFRCNVPRTTGVVHWMLNSAWPSLYWQLYDWYGNPTAGYYGARKACEPVQLVFNYADHCVWAVNDAVPVARGTARMRIYGTDSRLLREESLPLESHERHPQKLFENITGPCFLALDLTDGEGNPVGENFYCLPAADNQYAWDKAQWWGTPIGQYADLSFVARLPEASIRMDVKAEEDGYAVILTNESDVIAYQNILKAVKEDGMLEPGAFWSDNFFTLLPHESKTVKCRLPQGETATLSLSAWNTKTTIL